MKKLLNISYISHIKELKPMEQSFVYSSQKWKLLDKNFKELLSDFVNKEISRLEIIKSYRDYFSGKSEAVKPFLMTLIWGYANTGYGYSRTKPLIKRSVFKNIISAIDELKEDKIEIAFEKLQSIKGLGISFISKILYFSSKALEREDYQLIFDSRVASSLLKLSVGEELSKLFKLTPSDKFEDYEDYNKLMHNMAKENSLEADSIEMFFYEQKF